MKRFRFPNIYPVTPLQFSKSHQHLRLNFPFIFVNLWTLFHIMTDVALISSMQTDREQNWQTPMSR